MTTKSNRNTSTEYLEDSINAAGVGASFINDRIHPVMDALVELADFGNEKTDAREFRLRMSTILHLAKVGRYLTEDAAGFMESMERDVSDKLKLAQGEPS